MGFGTTDFVEVLRCFLLILQRIGPEVWQGEGNEYPLVVFNTIKDNAGYIGALRADPPANLDPWTLNCLLTYLKSLDRLPAFKEVLPVMMQFLCEGLQHERFQRIQPSAVEIASKVMPILAVTVLSVIQLVILSDAVCSNSRVFVWQCIEGRLSTRPYSYLGDFGHPCC